MASFPYKMVFVNVLTFSSSVRLSNIFPPIKVPSLLVQERDEQVSWFVNGEIVWFLDRTASETEYLTHSDVSMFSS